MLSSEICTFTPRLADSPLWVGEPQRALWIYFAWDGTISTSGQMNESGKTKSGFFMQRNVISPLLLPALQRARRHAMLALRIRIPSVVVFLNVSINN